MKPRTQILLFIATVIFLSTVFFHFAFAQVRAMPYQPDLIEKSIIKSNKKYSTAYKVIRNKRTHYTNEIELLFTGKIEFSEYNRNGELRKSYSFPLSECKIYKSK